MVYRRLNVSRIAAEVRASEISTARLASLVRFCVTKDCEARRSGIYACTLTADQMERDVGAAARYLASVGLADLLDTKDDELRRWNIQADRVVLRLRVPFLIEAEG